MFHYLKLVKLANILKTSVEVLIHFFNESKSELFQKIEDKNDLISFITILLKSIGCYK